MRRRPCATAFARGEESAEGATPATRFGQLGAPRSYRSHDRIRVPARAELASATETFRSPRIKLRTWPAGAFVPERARRLCIGSRACLQPALPALHSATHEPAGRGAQCLRHQTRGPRAGAAAGLACRAYQGRAPAGEWGASREESESDAAGGGAAELGGEGRLCRIAQRKRRSAILRGRQIRRAPEDRARQPSTKRSNRPPNYFPRKKWLTEP